MLKTVNSESSAAGGSPAVGDWRSRSVPKAYPKGEQLSGGLVGDLNPPPTRMPTARLTTNGALGVVFPPRNEIDD